MNALTNNTATLFRRYLWLLDVIYSAGRITLDEIRVRWQRNEMSGGEELPRKTFENHRKAVEELFDVNIACDRRTNEYYVECGDDLVRDDLRRWLLETFAVNDLLVNSKRLRRRIALEPIPSGYAYLTAVLRAMEENRCLEIVYRHTYDEKRENRYEVEPYGLKAFRRRWYLIADSVEMGGIYAFALDRVRDMVPTSKAAEIPSDFDCAEFYADAFGIIRERDRKAERVEIRVLGKQANYVRALPLHPTQRETERTAEYSVFEYRLAPTYDFRMELLSNGADVEVLRPAWFREEVKNVVTKMMDRYKRT